MQVHLIDGTFELFRAYFGAPSALAPDGREVGATRALLRMLGRPFLQARGAAGAAGAAEAVAGSEAGAAVAAAAATLAPAPVPRAGASLPPAAK